MKSKASEVSRCLHRLSGVYQDPSRVSRDATTLLQSETGKHLLVQSSTFLQNDGSETASLLVTGTIAMFYRGVTYNTPIDMYLPPHYPNRPPITFVRPAAASMMIKEGHNHVGSDGMVYMPYLSSWQKQSHNLVDACLNMSSIFSNEPPCYAKPPGYNANANANAASTRPAAATSTAANVNVNFNGSTASSASASTRPTPTPPRYQDIASSIFAKVPIPGRKKTATNNTNTNTNTNNVQVPSEQEQIDQLAREAEAANDAVKIARAADAKEEQEQRLLTKDRQRLTSRCNDILTSYKKASSSQLTDLIGDEMLLHKSSALLKDRIAYLHKRRGELETYHTQIDASIVEMQNYIQGAEEEKNGRGEVSADEMALPADIQSGQMLILSAENAAINDALFFLDKGLAENNGDNGYGLEVHMAAVRKLAKKQFLVRAHLLKIGQGKAYSSR